MKFENKGKWLQEAEEEKLVFDNREKADFNEEDELSGELLSEVESDEFIDELDRPEEEEDAIAMANESSQKNEGSITVKAFRNWPKRNQVKQAIDKADEKTFLKLMDEFTDMVNGEDFPQIMKKNGKLVFAETDDLVTLDSLENEWFADKYFFESSQKNESPEFEKDVKEIIRYVNAAYGKIADNKKKLDFWSKKYRATYEPLKHFSLSNMKNGSYTVELAFNDLDPTILKQAFNDAVKSRGLTKPRKLGDLGNKYFIYESSQKNEAHLDRSDDIKFDIIGGGFEIISHLISGVHSGYGLYCSGYSDNSKAPGFVNDAITDDREGYDKLQKERLAIAKEILPFANKFEQEIEKVFNKHGFKNLK